MANRSIDRELFSFTGGTTTGGSRIFSLSSEQAAFFITENQRPAFRAVSIEIEWPLEQLKLESLFTCVRLVEVLQEKQSVSRMSSLFPVRVFFSPAGGEGIDATWLTQSGFLTKCVPRAAPLAGQSATETSSIIHATTKWDPRTRS